MADCGFDSGPLSKKSKTLKTSSPTSSMTSFDPDCTDLDVFLSELSSALSPELSNPVVKLQSPDGVWRQDEKIQNNHHLLALLGTDEPPIRVPMNSGVRFPLNTPGLPTTGIPTLGLAGSLPHERGATVSWPLHQSMNFHPHRYPMVNSTAVEVLPQSDMLTPVEFASPGASSSFVGGQAFGATYARGTIYPNMRMAYTVPTRIGVPDVKGPRLFHGLVGGSAQCLDFYPRFSDAEKLASDSNVHGVDPVHLVGLSTKQFGPPPGIMPQPLPHPLMNARSDCISEINALRSASDISQPLMSLAPSRTQEQLSVALAETVSQCSSLQSRLPSDSGNMQHNNTEKQRLIQQQLVLIFHACNCHRREQANGLHQPPCPLPLCQSMKNVLRHMVACTEGRLCKVPHCSSSRQIFGHWRNCIRPDCPICAPLRNGSLRRPIGASSTAGPTSMAGALTVVNSAYEAFSPKHATAVQPPANGTESNTTQMSHASSAIGIGAMCTDPKSLQSSLGEEEEAEPIMGQDWRVSVTQDLRNHLVHKLVQAIFPTQESMALKDPRIGNLVRYAKKVEGDMYERARSREDYYHLLAEKIYKIQKELEQKKLLKMLDQNGLKSSMLRMPLSDTSVTSQANSQMALPSSPLSIMSGEALRLLPLHADLHPTSMNGTFMDTGLGASSSLSRQAAACDTFGLGQGPSSANTVAFGAAVAQTGDNSRLEPFFTDAPQKGAGQIDNVAENFLTVRQMESKLQVASVLSKRRQEMDELKRRLTQSELISPSSEAVSSFLQTLSGAPTFTDNFGTTYSQSWETDDRQGMSIKQEMTFEPFFSPDSGMVSSGLDSMTQSIGSHMNSDVVGYDSLSLSSSEVKVDVKHEDITDDEMGTNPEPSKPSRSIDASDGKLKKEAEVNREFEEDQNVMFECQRESGVKLEMKMDTKMEPATEEKMKKDPEVDERTSSAELRSRPPDNRQMSSAKLNNKPGKKVWTLEELKQSLMPVIDKLYSIEPEAVPFRCPVDRVALGIPDYFHIVKRPMDLSTIRSKLESGEYTDPWNILDDVWLMFDNAWLYNRKTSKVYKYCTKLAEVFESEVDPVMQSLGFCCGRRYVFTPQVLCCFGKQLCVIPRDSTYYNYLDRYIYCEKCFNELPGSEIEIPDDLSNPGLKIKKESFLREKNDKLVQEIMIDCLECGRQMHKICALHLEQIWTTGFICRQCCQVMDQKRKENKFTAKRLPPTKLGSYLENRVNSLLKRKASGAGDVAVRVLSSYDKVAEVKPAMKAKFVDNGLMSESFPYRVKSIFAFEEIDGTDVCFFGMHVQEYGSDCPPNNARRVYIAYLDSVNFFQPCHFRTMVYHELLIGYMDYVKGLGYQVAHIWACPPSEGDDYIFYCHPPDMKIPKPKRLQEWYRRMLDKAMCDNVIFDYKDIFKDFKDNMKDVSELPYFEGDFWPNVLEENIKELNQELEKRQKEEEEAAADTDDAEANDANSTEIHSVAGKKKDQKSGQTKKKNTKTKKLSSRRSKTSLLQGSTDLTERVLLSMEKHREVFFVIRLQSKQPDSELNDIKDPDPLMNIELLDGRDPFLTMAREKHLEFSSLRRAKFSTSVLLYELHLQAKDSFIYTCNSCRANVETRYHCSVCEDFDLCVLCFRKIQHPHRMMKLGLDLDDGSQIDTKPQNAQEARRLKMQSYVQVLEHSCICRDANCTLASCRNMRKALAFHPKECRRKSRSACAACKQLFALCCYHAKSCREKRCLVPFCQNIKTSLEKKRQNERFQQQRLILRRAAMMNCVDDAGINESAVPLQSIQLMPGYGVFTDGIDNGESPSVPGNEVMFHPNVQPFGVSGGGKAHASLPHYLNPHADFLPSPQPFYQMDGIGYGSVPGTGTGSVGHFVQPEILGHPHGPLATLESTVDGINLLPPVTTNQMSLEKLMKTPGDKQKLLRLLKGNPRLMAEVIKKVRQHDAHKQQQLSSVMSPGSAGTRHLTAAFNGSMRNPLMPFQGQMSQQPAAAAAAGVAPGQAMITAVNGDNSHIHQQHQSPQQAPQMMSPGFDAYQPGMMSCHQPYPGFVTSNCTYVSQDYVGNHIVNQMPFHQMPRPIHPQLINRSSPQQPHGPLMNPDDNYLLSQDVGVNAPGGGMQRRQTCDPSPIVCMLPSASPLPTSSPHPVSNSSSPLRLPPHYVNIVLPHSTDLSAVQRTGVAGVQQTVSASNMFCQDAVSAHHLAFTPNAKSLEMSNSTLSRRMEHAGSLQQQLSSVNSYLHFLDQK